jgi:chaperone modulatory protein CbpM
MMTFEDVRITFKLENTELSGWIEQSWVRPLRQGEGWHFDDGDVARLQLICELKREMAVNDEAIPLVLELLDQLYATRATLDHLRHAMDRLSEPALAELEGLLGKEQG